MPTWLDPNHLLETFGTVGLIAIVFAESGLLIGFFLPGDSLLVTAGLLASQTHAAVHLSLPVILVGCFVAAVLGDQVGYQFGARVGPALFRRPDSRFFKRDNIDRAQAYFDKQGSKTIVIARFVPVVRTFAPIVAGIGAMKWRTFAVYNLVGGFLWSFGVILAGYELGKTVKNIDKYLLPIIALIVVVSAIPVVLEVLRQRRSPAAKLD